MSSKTEIANRALSLLGIPRVSNIATAGNKPANVINGMWDIERRSLIAAYPWNFAAEMASLAKLSAAPAHTWDNQYQLPSDYLMLTKVENDPRYEIMQKKILTDEGSPLKIWYVKDITETGDFDPLFAKAFAVHLAHEACEELTQSNSKKADLAQHLQAVLTTAWQVDAIQEPAIRMNEDSWIDARENTYPSEVMNYNSDS